MKITNFFPNRRKSMIPITNRVQYANTSLSIEWIKDNYIGYINDGYASNSDLYAVISYLNELAPNIRYRLVDANGVDKSASREAQPLMALMRQPQTGYTYGQWLKQVLGYRWLTGNTFIWASWLQVGVNAGRTVELQILPTQCVSIQRDRTTGALTYDLAMGALQKRAIPADEIGHIRMPQYMFGGDVELYGMSPLKAGLRTLTASNEGLTSQVRRFQNQYGDGIVGVKEGITEEQAKRLQSTIERNSGSQRAGSITVVGSDLTYQRFGISAVDSQLIQSLGLGLHTFCRMYNVPPELVDPSVGKTYNNVREAKSAVYTMSVIPAVQEVFDLINNWVVPRYTKTLHFELDTSAIPELQKDVAAIANAFKGVWQITPNEFRVMIGLEPIANDPDMDQVWIPTTLMPLEFQTPIPGGNQL